MTIQFKHSERSDVLEAVAQLHRMNEIHLRDRLLNSLQSDDTSQRYAPPATVCSVDEITAHELIETLEPVADDQIHGQTYPYHPLNKVIKDCHRIVNTDEQ